MQANKFLLLEPVVPSLALEMADIVPEEINSLAEGNPYALEHFTPARPIAEPPEFDYEGFFETTLSSDFRMRLIFPDDVEKRTKYRDTMTELALIRMYWKSVTDLTIALTFIDLRKDTKPGKFYYELAKELNVDRGDLWREFEEVDKDKTKDRLALWEFKYLDQDGGTRKLESYLQNAVDVDWEHVPAAIVKYAYLTRYHECMKRERLEDWEYEYLESDGGIAKIQGLIAKGKGDKIFDPNVYP